MDTNQLKVQHYIKIGIIVVLFIIELIAGILLDNNYNNRDGEIYLAIYMYVVVAFPVLTAFWFLFMIIDTIILTFKKRTHSRNINLIIIFMTILALVITVLAVIK